MSIVTIPYRYGARGGTAADLATVNEIPLIQELVFETDTLKFKLGDGVTHYNDLEYAGIGKVDLSGLSDGDVLVWDAGAGKWVAGTVDIAGATHAATSKATPVDADEIPLADSAASWILKKLTWSNLKATLKTYFDSLYVGGPASSVNNRVALFDGVTGKLIKDSGLTLSGTNTGDQTGVTAGSATSGTWVIYNGITQAAGQWDGGTTAPSHTTRLNYDGYFHATQFFGDGSNLTGISGAVLNQNSLPYVVQTLISRGSWAYFLPNSNANTTTYLGFDSTLNTAVGTGSAVNVASTNGYTRQTRRAYTSVATAGATAGVYVTAALCCGSGGFYWSTRFGIADAAAVANARLFVGLRAAIIAPVNADPSSYTDIICVGADTGDTNLQVMHNDSSGTATKVDLGASFPANTRSTDFYEVQFLSLPGTGVVNVYVLNVTTGLSTQKTINTNLPSASTLLGWSYFRQNGSTALAVKLEAGGWAWGTNLEG